MDGTQTSEPTEAGSGSTPGRASASRALDEQAITEGPLDLTVPLNIAEIRAALATTGPQRKAKPVTPADASASVGGARPQESRNGSRHAGPRRLGRIAAFVAVAATLSVGTAGALVLSNNSTSQSVSLPASGAIPVAPSTGASQPGQGAMGSGSTSAHATPGLSRSATDVDPVSDGQSTSPVVSSWPTGKHRKGGPSATATAPSSSFSPSDPVGTGAAWQPLYPGNTGSKVQSQETSYVQTALNDIGYLQPYPHKSYVLPQYSGYAAGPDPSGHYGSATSDAIASFQQNFNIPYSGPLGVCDLQTYQALMVVISTASPSPSATQ